MSKGLKARRAIGNADMSSEGCNIFFDDDPDSKSAVVLRIPKCVLERVFECACTSDQHLPISGADDMNTEKEILCGAHIHRDYLWLL